MSLNVIISKKANESASSILRRFTKEIQNWGGLNKVRSKRYAERGLSAYKTKIATLKKIKNNEIRLNDIKLGKFFNTQKTK
jgi:ribosomal protein S21